MATWWIDEPFMLGSSNPSDADVERLRADGFRVIVCLLDENQQPPRYDPARVRALGYERHNIPVRDFHAPSLEQLEQFVALVRSVGANAKVLVHCEAGLGRTGTMAAAYWISKGLAAADAIERTRRIRPGAVESEEQHRVLHEFAKRWSAHSSSGNRFA